MEQQQIDFNGRVALYDADEHALMTALKANLAHDRATTLRELGFIHALKATFPGSRILPEDDSRGRAGALR